MKTVHISLITVIGYKPAKQLWFCWYSTLLT